MKCVMLSTRKNHESYLQHQAFQEDGVIVRILGNHCKSVTSFSQQILRKQ